MLALHPNFSPFFLLLIASPWPCIVFGQSYSVSQSGSYSIEIDSPTSFDLQQDGVAQIPIGFDFTFFGQTYADCYVGGDGFITFGSDPGNYCCGQELPDPDPANNLIAVAWTNMDYSAGTFEVFGAAPFRKLVITFDLANPCGETYYGQVKLYESTNVIEIHTQEWNQNQCQGWTATQGIENGDGTEAVVVPGRNYNDTWQVNFGDEDFVSFTPVIPSGPTYTVTHDGAYDIEIDDPTFIFFGEDDSYEIPIGFDFTFFDQTYSNCWIGSDGFVAFGDYPGGGCCGQPIPVPSPLNNVIAVAWTNMDWHSIHYEVYGDEPNRRLVITFDLRDACNLTYYGQVKLYESTNIIELHTQEWADGQTPCNNTVQGLENADGTEAFYWPGRNFNTDWTISTSDEDVVTFTPSNGGQNISYFVDQPNNFELEFEVPNDVTITADSSVNVPIGFDFSFFGNTYSSCYLNFNGFLSFTSTTDGCCEGQNIPDPAGPNNIIAPGWIAATNDECCYNNEGYNIYSYETIGEAPDRRFIAYFLLPEVCFQYYRGEIKLFEGSNIIEIHTDHWAQYNPPCENATQGIENANGTAAFFVDGRVANTVWSVASGTNDVVRFSPYAIPPYDAGVNQVYSGPFCSGDQPMACLISNYGFLPIDSVFVEWEFDGVPQTPINYHAAMPAGGMNFIIVLDTINLQFGTPHTIKAWTSMPNGFPDENPANDTMFVDVTVGMSGEFTIGGSSPDYPSFNAAIVDLQSFGVCDTTIFNVRPGVYNERVIISNIPGSNVNPIIFQAENGDSSSVILQYSNSNFDSNYVLRLTNAYGILWQKMTLNAIGDVATVIALDNNCQNNTIAHCAITGKNVTSSFSDFFCIHSKSNNEQTTFFQNTIKFGSTGFYHQYQPDGPIGFQEGESMGARGGGGGGNPLTPGIKLIGNTFLEFANKGIQTSETRGLQIHRNTFNSAKANAKGIDVDLDIDTLVISHNQIYLSSGAQGMEITNVDAPTGQKSRIFNNMISVPGNNCFAGISCSFSDRMWIYDNSVRISTNVNGRYAFFYSSGVQGNVYNNVFANMGGGTVIYADNVFGNDIDYNDLYTTGAVLGLSGIYYSNLALWSAGTGFDEHSVSVNPLFTSVSDLHAINSFLNGNGSPAFSDAIDIDGESRNATTPDIGADEFVPVATDVAITKLLSPTLSCTAEQNIEIVLANVGADTLHYVTLQWTLNGVAQPDSVYDITLMPEGDTAHVVISTHTFSNQKDSIRIWVTMPNGVTDLQHSNDTIFTRFRLPLSGVYTIGGTSPDFTTITGAVKDLNLFHTCGPVTFKIRNGVYNEQVEVDSIPTVSELNTITFESESLDSSAVTIQYAPTTGDHPAVFMLKGTDYVTIRHLGFKALPSTWADCIELRYNAKHINVTHCYLEAYEFGGSSGIGIKSLCFNSPRNEYLTIDHNYFFKGQQAIYIYNCGNYVKDIYVENNTFTNQRFTCMDLSFIDGLYVRNNVISTNTTNTGYKGIDLSSLHSNMEISGNTMNLLNTGDGMFLDGVNYGTFLGTAKVFNNMIKTSGTGGGIRLWNCEGVLVAYNSCNMTGNGPAFEAAGGDSLTVKNNIFVTNTGKAFGSFAWTPHMFSDYNDLLTISGSLGFWHDTLYPTFTDWKNGTHFDSNSMNFTPQFVSPTDLHVLADTLDGAGIPIAGITTDIDGNPRNAITPDIGADEIGANDNDAGVFAILPEMPFARGMQPVKAVIRNFGGNTLTSMNVSWRLNNTTQTTFNYTGSLPTLQQDTVTLGIVDFSLSTAYNLKAWTSLPNGAVDYYNSNDTLTTSTRYAAVSDTVTIGGSMPDVSTIAAAYAALSLGGVRDSVHFQLRNGTYSTPLSMEQTIGMNCNTPIIFESESGNAGDVIWDNTGINAHTILLDGADGVQFKNLTLRTVVPAYHAVEFRNSATCNSFIDCQIEGVTTTSTSTSQAVVYSNSGGCNNNHFIGNTVKKGSYSIYWSGDFQTTGALIQNNHFENAYYTGALLSLLDAPVVDGNILSVSSVYPYFLGIYLNQCDLDVQLTRNQVLMTGTRGIGFVINSCHGNSTQKMLIANNFVILGNSNDSYGIQHAYCEYADVYYNTVRVSGGNGSGIAYYRIYGTNINIRNNIFDNHVAGPAMYFAGNEGPLTSNNNDLLTTGVNLIYKAGTYYVDLEAWQATNFDTNSISLDPMYVSDNGFAITSAALNGIGEPVSAVSVDIEGENRDTLTPDIGCDEFYLATDDVGILNINFPKEPFPSGENTVFIKFVNNGQDTLTSMQVDWEVDGNTQPTYIWTGLLPSAGTYDSLDIGIYNFAPYQFHNIKVWVSQPNGVQDGLASNDTLQVDSLYTGLLGNYTIGGTDPDFDSIAVAVYHLNHGGVAGPVTFNIRTGTYLETINLIDYPGSECDRPVIFQSETGDSTDVVITNLGINDNVITLNGTDGVHFSRLTLQSVHPVYQNVVEYFNGAHCNEFSHDRLIGYQGNTTDFNKAVVISTNSLDTANIFSHNQIQFGSVAFYITGNGQLAHTRIEDNFLDRNYYYGIYASSESGIRIIHNKILSSGFGFYSGIYLEYCHGDNQIERNDVQGSLQYNILRLEGCHAMYGPRARVANNFFSGSTEYSSSGVQVNNCKRYDFIFNNINLNSNLGSTALYFHSDSSLYLANNIIVHTGAGQAIYGHNLAAFGSDYNDIYSVQGFGQWNGNGIINLGAWQAATGQDSHSLSINPQFMSGSNLHVSNILLDGEGIPIPDVTLDMDGNSRGNPPDIGADEFVPGIANDAGIFMFIGPHAPFVSGVQPVLLAVKNYGFDTLTSVDVRWIVNGIEQTIHHWTGSLPSAQCDTFVVGNYNFAPHADHDFISWSENPNAVQDSTNVNDTLYMDDVYPALLGTYTVGGVLPDFNVFSQLENALNKGGILGNVSFHIRDGIYSTQLKIGNFPRNQYAHQVTFSSESGDSSEVVITRDFYKPNANYTINLANAHHIVFDKITLASNQGRILDIGNGSSCITVSHCAFNGVQVPYITFQHQLLYSTTSSEDSLTVQHSRFTFGDIGLYLGGSGGDPEQGINIEQNEFNNCRYRSIEVHDATGLKIIGNKVYNEISDHEGIVLTSCINTLDISNNDIRMLMGGNYGIYLQGVSGTSGVPASISNNYIFIQGWPYASHGIYHGYSNYNQFNYNTVRIENTGSGSSAFTDNSSNQNIHLRNCNFANYSGGVAMYVIWLSGFTNNTTNYCNLFSNGPNLVRYYNFYPDLASMQAGTNQNLQGKSAEPLFVDDGPGVTQAALNGTALPIATITSDIYGNPRNATNPDIGAREFNLLTHDVGAKLLVSPSTYCGLSNAEDITLRIQNYGASIETGFNVAYSINGAAWVVENIGSATVLPGGTADYTFTTSENLGNIGTYTFKIRTDLASDLFHANDTVKNIEVVHIPALTQAANNLVPADLSIHIDKPVSLSWNPAPNATLYDVFIWKVGDPVPVEPQVENLNVINTSYDYVNYGDSYSWKVRAKNICGQTTITPVQTFMVRELPDLKIDSISAPSMAVSEQQIQLEWQVNNIGLGNTQSTLWTDAVYLSIDATLNTSFDTYLGGVQNLTALEPGESYLQTGTFTIPQGFSGEYYVFIYSDRYNNLIETNNNNNWERTVTQIQITLLPPPDLVIDQVITPVSAFSGQAIQIQYTGRNNGTGDIPASTWKDRIKLSQDGSSSAGGQVLSSLTINGPLEVDSIYSRTVTITLPNSIFGDYYIYVETDYQNNVYEFAAENNNSNVSDTFDIFLTPPPNLVNTAIVFPDSISSNELLNYTWTITNQGGTSPTEQYWYDYLYLSLSPVYNTNFLTVLNLASKVPPVNPTNSYTQVKTGRMPTLAEGSYYIYAYTDRHNNVFEYTFENDNITRYGPYTLVNPDMEPVNIVYPMDASSGESVSLHWDLVNHGPGKMAGRYLRYKYFVSTQPVFNSLTAQEVKTTYSGEINIDALDTLHLQSNITIPPGLNGEYYFYVKVESLSLMLEHNDAYANNIGRGNAVIDIDPGPYPDLHTLSISVPDTAVAGQFISVTYTQANSGGADAILRGNEAIYISFDSIWHPHFATLISENNFTSSLAEDSSVSVTRNVFIPVNTTSNVYYIYLVSDKNNVVFEYTGESNNIKRSDPFFLNPYPPVDIAIDDINLPSLDLYSGVTYPVSYLVHSIAAPPTRTQWDDVVILSVDSIHDQELDLQVVSFPVQTAALQNRDTLTLQKMVKLPNGIQGDYYFMIEADEKDLNMDDDRDNNVNQYRAANLQSTPVHITLSPYPDLVVSSIAAPSSAVAGQPCSISFTISNTGTGNAMAWEDRIYISGDNLISNGDIQIFSARNTQGVTAGNSTSDTVVVNLPGYLSGNYFLIMRTDFLDELYEYTGETNNSTSRVIQITTPPPSDLHVQAIAIPDSLIAGESTTITWTTKNTGTYPAYGQVREIVYLSSDTTWSVEDQVFGVNQSQLYLPPQSMHVDSLLAPIIGVANEDYYALVRTDALQNVPETNEENNISSSIDPAYIDVKTLYLDSLTADSLHNGRELYYKLIVDPANESQSILVSLGGDSANAYNELFVSFNEAPTRGNYQFSNNKPQTGKQQVVLRNAQVGTYYILAYGSSSTDTIQDITLFARVMSYEILAVSPPKGSNRGQVTLVIDGSRLDSTYAVRLRDTSGYVLLADTFVIVSPEKIIATFNLQGTAVGYYSVECQVEPYYIASLENGFEVIEGMGPDLEVNWFLAPGSTTPRNKPVKIMVVMINNGDADVVQKNIRINSPYGNVMATTYDNLIGGNTFPYLDIPAQLQSGLEGVLPPGNSATYEVFSWLHPFPFYILDVK